MTKKQTIILIVGAVVIVVGFSVLFSAEPSPQTDSERSDNQPAQERESDSDMADRQNGEQTSEQGDQGTDEGEAETADQVIARTESGYEPKNVTIEKGDTVLWTNESDDHHWPASDVHPTHRIYSEFDPERPIAPGETWSFTFEQTGEWKFHDHLRANLTGTITVTE